MCEGLSTLSNVQSSQTYEYAINGYDDTDHCGDLNNIPCFLPYENVTRGQFSKILAITMGWTYYGNTQHFTDVPSTNPFYIYIEAIYNSPLTSEGERVMSGYADGTFRPGNNITRGQISKMSSNARNYTENMSSRQPTYADVPATDPFFKYIERLTLHIANPPYSPNLNQPTCLSTNPQKPCFHQYATVVRADAAEFAYLTLFGPGTWGQVFPHRYGGTAGWDAVNAYVSTPDPAPDPGVSGDRWIATPVGLSILYSLHFVEAGAQKLCDASSNCTISPYSSWSAGAGVFGWRDTSVLLTPGAGYTYRVDPDGSAVWRPTWCNTKGCYGILNTINNRTGNLGITSFPFYVAGGESNNLAQHWGDIYIYNVYEHYLGGNWTVGDESCYDPIIVPWITGYGTVSRPCTNGTWTVNY